MQNENWQTRVAAWLVGLFLLAMGLWGAWAYLNAAVIGDTITSPDQYAAALRAWKDPEQVRHFPPAIPPTATMVRFSYFAGFMQGGPHLQLRVKVSPAEAAEALERFGKRATARFAGGTVTSHAREPGGVYTTSFFTGDDQRSLCFPDSYTLLVLDAQDRAGGTWNHGRTAGVAVDTTRSEIVYWAESW